MNPVRMLSWRVIICCVLSVLYFYLVQITKLHHEALAESFTIIKTNSTLYSAVSAKLGLNDEKGKDNMPSWVVEEMEWMENEKKRWEEKVKGINFTDEAEANREYDSDITTQSHDSWYMSHVDICKESTNRTSWTELTEATRAMVAQRIVINEHYKILYCPIPLVSTGPFMRLMYALEWNTPVAQVSSKLTNKRENFVYFSDYTLEDQQYILKTYSKFLVVRNPLLRLVAVYKQKFASSNAYFHERYGKEIVRKFRKGLTGEPKGDDVSFQEFVQYIGFLNPRNEHWMPQEHLCRPCEMKYDFAVRHEFVKEDSSVLLNRFGLEKAVDAVPVDAWDHITGTEAKIMYDHVPAATLGRLAQLYQKDFELFGYSSFSIHNVN